MGMKGIAQVWGYRESLNIFDVVVHYVMLWNILSQLYIFIWQSFEILSRHFKILLNGSVLSVHTLSYFSGTNPSIRITGAVLPRKMEQDWGSLKESVEPMCGWPWVSLLFHNKVLSLAAEEISPAHSLPLCICQLRNMVVKMARQHLKFPCVQEHWLGMSLECPHQFFSRVDTHRTQTLDLTPWCWYGTPCCHIVTPPGTSAEDTRDPKQFGHRTWALNMVFLWEMRQNLFQLDESERKWSWEYPLLEKYYGIPSAGFP